MTTYVFMVRWGSGPRYIEGPIDAPSGCTSLLTAQKIAKSMVRHLQRHKSKRAPKPSVTILRVVEVLHDESI